MSHASQARSLEERPDGTARQTDRRGRGFDPVGTVNQDRSTSPSPQDGVHSSQEMDSEPDFRLSLDFGTTYSSIAFTKKDGNSKEICTIGSFPDDPAPGLEHGQVPTELLFLRLRKPDQPVTLRKSSRILNQPPSTPCMTRTIKSRILDQSPSTSGTSKRVKKPKPYQVRYGYQVHKWMEGKGDRRDYEVLAHVSRMKHLLNDSGTVCEERTRLKDSIDLLQRHSLIRSGEDLILMILEYYFIRTKKVLKNDHGLRDANTIELTITVPVCWTTKSHAIMERCVDVALQKAQLGYLGKERRVTFFMVNEAEAGASYVLHTRWQSLKIWERLLITDIGGGTSDCGLYRVRHEHPLRLVTEINTVTGAVCGSGDVNEIFRAFLLYLLSGEIYLEADIEIILDGELMPLFERDHKRRFEYLNTEEHFFFPVRGLRKHESDPRLDNGQIVLDYDDMWSFFQPSFKIIWELIEGQISTAILKGEVVDKVVLIGGFADSPALREFVKQQLGLLSRARDCNITLVDVPRKIVAAGVAIGGIIRASDQRHGPNRIPRQSLGISRIVYYEDGLNRAYIHDQRPKRHNGEMLIKDTILWVFKKSEEPVPPEQRKTFKSIYPFPRHAKSWEGREILYASEHCTEDFYRCEHEYNKGKITQIGEITFDLTHLRERYINDMSSPDHLRKDDIIEVETLIEIVINDRDMRIFVRWPAEDTSAVLEDSRKSFAVAAVFEPGTE